MFKIVNVSNQMIPILIEGHQYNLVPSDSMEVVNITDQIRNLSNPLRGMINIINL